MTESVNEIGKYVAQAKELIEKYVKRDMECRCNYTYLEEAVVLLNKAIDKIA